MCNPLRHIHSLSYFLNFFLCNKCIPVKRHLISRGPKEPAKSKKVRKTIRKKLLNRSANRAGKKLWTGLLERQEKDLTDKGKTRAAAAETSRRSGRVYLNKRNEIEEKRQRRPQEEADEPTSTKEKKSRRRLKDPMKKKKKNNNPFKQTQSVLRRRPSFSSLIEQESRWLC